MACYLPVWAVLAVNSAAPTKSNLYSEQLRTVMTVKVAGLSAGRMTIRRSVWIKRHQKVYYHDILEI